LAAKRARNDACHGTGHFFNPRGEAVTNEKSVNQKHQPISSKIFRSGLLKPHMPSTIAVMLSMLYGGHYAATTHAEYSEVAHQAFKSAFFGITQLWSQFSSVIGIPDNSFVTSVVEFLAVMISLFFALFAGIGGVVVYVFQILFHS
jgi:hypothetical protein